MCLLTIRVKAGITVIDGEARKPAQATAYSLKSGIAWQQHRQEIIQFVKLRYRKSPFLQKSLEKLLGGLLRVKADFIVRGWVHGGQCLGDSEVAFGLANPRRGELFHTGRCPCRRSRAGTNLLLAGASEGYEACGR